MNLNGFFSQLTNYNYKFDLTAYKYRQIGPIYYEYGSLIVTYDNADIAVKAYYMLRESFYDDKNLLVLLLPNIMADMIPQGVRVLKAFK